jgi:N-acetylglucosamine malate deacetylase 1
MDNKKLRILVIGAHPDDCELGTGGTAIKYCRLGHIVKYVYATNGDAGHHELGGVKLAQIRAKEVRKSCAVAGIEYEILDNHDAYLEVNIKLREKFIRLIRDFKPDIIITHRPNDYHPDHRNTSLLLQDSSYLITVPNVCPLSPIVNIQPVILYIHDNFKKPYEFSPDIVVGIDDVVEDKVEMLNCHQSQFYEWLPWNRGEISLVPEDADERKEWLYNDETKRNEMVANRYRDKLLERYGYEYGIKIKFAEAFEISEYGRHLDKKEISQYFPF